MQYIVVKQADNTCVNEVSTYSEKKKMLTKLSDEEFLVFTVHKHTETVSYI
jgi:hypothetical protein